MATGKALDGKPYAGNPHVRNSSKKSFAKIRISFVIIPLKKTRIVYGTT